MLGQALDCGLEDVSVFAATLMKHKGDVDMALQAYNTQRRPDLKALLNVDELLVRAHYPVMTKVCELTETWCESSANGRMHNLVTALLGVVQILDLTAVNYRVMTTWRKVLSAHNPLCTATIPSFTAKHP